MEKGKIVVFVGTTRFDKYCIWYHLNLLLGQSNLFDSTWLEPYKCRFGWNPN